MTTIIGFGYRSRSGKDTAVSTIIGKYGIPQLSGVVSIGAIEGADLGRGIGITISAWDIRRYAFADEVKREVNDDVLLITGGNMERYITLRKNYGFIPEWVQYDPDAPMDDPLCPLGKQRSLLQFWGTDFRRAQNENYWVEKVQQRIAVDKPSFALLTDFRFPNEAKILNFKVKVDRPGITVLDHLSEHALDNFKDWDIVLDNNTSLEVFKDNTLKAFEFIRDFVSGKNTFYDRQSGLPR